MEAQLKGSALVLTHSRAVPSFAADMNPMPSTSCSARTASVWPPSVRTHCPACQSLIVLSADAVATTPSESSSTAQTAPACPASSWTSLPSRHTRQVLSHDPEIRSPLLAADSAQTFRVCPTSILVSPVAGCQSCSAPDLPEPEPDAIAEPPT
eukprot:SAG22_NODE_35_length_27276_cov_20.395849_9_plen_153_part_00